MSETVFSCSNFMNSAFKIGTTAACIFGSMVVKLAGCLPGWSAALQFSLQV